MLQIVTNFPWRKNTNGSYATRSWACHGCGLGIHGTNIGKILDIKSQYSIVISCFHWTYSFARTQHKPDGLDHGTIGIAIFSLILSRSSMPIVMPKLFGSESLCKLLSDPNTIIKMGQLRDGGMDLISIICLSIPHSTTKVGINTLQSHINTHMDHNGPNSNWIGCHREYGGWRIWGNGSTSMIFYLPVKALMFSSMVFVHACCKNLRNASKISFCGLFKTLLRWRCLKYKFSKQALWTVTSPKPWLLLTNPATVSWPS